MFRPLGLSLITSVLPIVLVLVCQNVRADVFTLYDASGLPNSQPWLSFASNGIISGGTATQSQQAIGVRLQTDLAVSAGYGNYTPFSQFKNVSFPSLDRAKGFELSFSLSLENESHSNANRAGFSVSLLGSDSRGVELAFWGNEIWAQQSNPPFTHGEGINIDTTVQRDYRLSIRSDTYVLVSGAGQLLTGSVRDYSGFGSPYNLPNFLFIGDNTSSGAAGVLLGPVSLESNLSAVPEPSSYHLMLAVVLLLVAAEHYRRYFFVYSLLKCRSAKLHCSCYHFNGIPGSALPLVVRI